MHNTKARIGWAVMLAALVLGTWREGGASVILQIFSATAPGLVPASGGGTVNFIRADGTWAVPPGAGSGSVTSVATGCGASGGTITTTGTITGVGVCVTIANASMTGTTN